MIVSNHHLKALLAILVSQKHSIANNYMVVTADYRATGSAIRILELGGSAIDAAISAQMVLNLVEPQSSGIGEVSLSYIMMPILKQLRHGMEERKLL